MKNAGLVFACLVVLITIPGCKTNTILKHDSIVLDRAELYSQAIQETSIPIKPGIPGESPFWNVNSTRFIYAPAFDFAMIEGAESYLFEAITEPDGEAFAYSALEPWCPLSEIWDVLPVGYIDLKVSALGAGGDTLGIAGERRFYRSAIFNGPYHKPVLEYRESAKGHMEWLFKTSYIQHWKTDSLPDPEYSLYAYPSKLIAAVIGGMLFYAELEPINANEAINIAKIAADYLIGVSEPKGSPFEYFPPTYNAHHIDMEKEYKHDVDIQSIKYTIQRTAGMIMLIYPSSAAHAYLSLYNKTNNEKYYNAALKIAETYQKLQDENGQWPLLVDTETGEAVSENFANTGSVLSLFLRFKDEYEIDSYDANIKKSEHLELEKLNAYDFEGQFEDQLPSERYQNLANGPALGAADYYLDLVKEDSSNLAIAEEFLHFAEDQFVVWSDPIPEQRPGQTSEEWFIFPCALEQYNCYTPIDGHASHFASMFLKAWQVSGKEIYLAKAISLANSITISQIPSTGRYPTWWDEGVDGHGWLNAGIGVAHTMNEIGEALSGLDIQY